MPSHNSGDGTIASVHKNKQHREQYPTPVAGEALGGFKLGMVISGQLLPVGLPPPRVHSGGHVATGHVVCRMCVRSTDPQVVHVLSKEAARWIQEVFGRTMVEGTNAGGLFPCVGI